MIDMSYMFLIDDPVENKQDKIKQVARLIKESKHLMVLTGAGMSTDSGIPAFRTADGLYSKYPSDVLSRNYFYQKTELFYEAFMEKFAAMLKAEPNEGHKILAKWQKEGYVKSIATQNIDNLHQRAVELLDISEEQKENLIKQIYEIHGTIKTFTVKAKGKIHKLKLEEILNEDGTIQYKRRFDGDSQTYIAKPDVVLFGEDVKHFSEVSKEVSEQTDVMLILGTSLQVTPFAYLPTYMRNSKNIIIINDVPIDPNVGWDVTIDYGIGIWDKITPVLKSIDEELKHLS